MIGKPQPELSADTNNLLIGKVNPFKVEAKNNWNKNYVSRIQTRVLKEGREISSRTSEDFTLPRYGSASISLFMDATTLQPGGYTLQLHLFFGESEASFSIPVVLGIEKRVTPAKVELPIVPIIVCFVVFAVSVALILLLRKKYKH